MNESSPAPRGVKTQEICEDVLMHFRNVMMVATLLALGLVARNRSGDLLGASLIQGTIGWGIITVAAALGLMNLWMGVNRLKQWKHWKLWSVVLLTAYVVIVARVLEVMALVHLHGK